MTVRKDRECEMRVSKQTEVAHASMLFKLTKKQLVLKQVLSDLTNRW